MNFSQSLYKKRIQFIKKRWKCKMVRKKLYFGHRFHRNRRLVQFQITAFENKSHDRGNGFGPEALAQLQQHGYQLARRGMQPEVPYG
ncbi:MAG TPA: hypothetical protein PKA26_07670, partial [bacterium]|nr:hypothetical protein [bacterium]